MADACTQTETSEIGTQTDEPNAFLEKQLARTADAVLKRTVNIMDESLRRLKATINGEMESNASLLKRELSDDINNNRGRIYQDVSICLQYVACMGETVHKLLEATLVNKTTTPKVKGLLDALKTTVSDATAAQQMAKREADIGDNNSDEETSPKDEAS